MEPVNFFPSIVYRMKEKTAYSIIILLAVLVLCSFVGGGLQESFIGVNNELVKGYFTARDAAGCSAVETDAMLRQECCDKGFCDESTTMFREGNELDGVQTKALRLCPALAEGVSVNLGTVDADGVNRICMEQSESSECQDASYGVPELRTFLSYACGGGQRSSSGDGRQGFDRPTPQGNPGRWSGRAETHCKGSGQPGSCSTYAPYAAANSPGSSAVHSESHPYENYQNQDSSEYILKSEIVPPVCPACPAVPSKESCRPCPPCARCPEPSFECKKVPNYKSDSLQAIPGVGPWGGAGSGESGGNPMPRLNSFSQFS